jgi:hypothetical protein
MSLSFEELLQLSQASSQPSEEEITPVTGGDVGIGEYIADVLITGPAKGLSNAVRGLLELGALPIDYIANTNLLKGIDKIFSEGFLKSPETKTSLGEITSVITQFGVPGGAALKIAGGISKLKGLSNMTKLSSLPSASAKGMELAKRAGYFGTIGGATDIIASTSEQGTLSDTLGITQQTDVSELEGSERASETLKTKLKFGAEGSVIGGAIPLLPTALTLGAKYGIIKPIQYSAPVVGGIIRAVDYPVSKAISSIVGKNETSLLQQAVIKTGALIDEGFKKTGIPDIQTWRELPTEGSVKNKVLRQLTVWKDNFTDDSVIGSIKNVQGKVLGKIAAEEKTISNLIDKIQETNVDVVKGYKFKLFDEGESLPYIQAENNKVFNLFKLDKKTQPQEFKETFLSLDKRIRKDALRAKNKIDEIDNRVKSYASSLDFKGDAALDFKTRAQQILPGFRNPFFKFDPTKEAKAVEFFKERILKDNIILKDIAKKTAKEVGEPGIYTENFGAKYRKTFNRLVDEQAKTEMLSLKSYAINTDAAGDLTTTFKGVANKTIVDATKVQPGETILDKRIQDLFSVPKGSQIKDIKTGKIIDVPVTDLKKSVMDAVLFQSEQYMSRKSADYILEQGLKDGWLVQGEKAANARSIGKINYKPVIAQGGPKTLVNDSILFSGTKEDQIYALPEIANAIMNSPTITDNLYKIPFYKSYMNLKAAAQVSKTILSPTTQVRNFTTASFFALANGLIGGKVGFKDAWRIISNDVLGSARGNIEQIARLENLISRNIIDQNVAIGDIKAVMNKAQQKGLSYEQMMNLPLMKKLTNVYQGADNYWKIYADDFYQGAMRTAMGNPDEIIAMTKSIDPKVRAQGIAKQADFEKQVKDYYRDVLKKEFKTEDIFAEGGYRKKNIKDMLEEMSAEIVTNTMPTYSKVPQIIKTIRDLPLGNFIAFPAEILRTTSNIVSFGARELTSTNPLIRQMGAKRLLGVTTVLGGAGTVIQKTAEYLTGVTPDQMESFQRSFAADYQKNSTLIPLSKPDDKGNFKYFNFSFSNPYDSLVTPVNAILRNFADGKLNKDSVDTIVMNALFGGALGGQGRKGAITEFLSPFLSESIGTERVTDVIPYGRAGKTSSGKTVYYEQDEPGVKIAKSFEHILGGLTPGAVTSANRVWQGATQKFTDTGTMRDGATELTALMSGLRVEEAKPLSSMPFIINSFQRDGQNINSKLSRSIYNAANTPEEKIASYKQFLLESYTSQNRMFTTLKDANDLGIDETDLEDLLKERLTKSTARDLVDGTFKIRDVSQKGFDSLIQRLEKEDPIAAAKFENQIENVLEIFDNLKDELSDFSLNSPIDALESSIDRILSPGVRQARQLIRPVAPAPRPAAPRVELPSGVTGASVNPQAVAAPVTQNLANLPLGERYNILFG